MTNLKMLAMMMAAGMVTPDEQYEFKSRKAAGQFGNKPSGAARSKRQAAKRRNVAKRLGK